MTTYDSTKFRKYAEEVNYKSLLNCYCREFNNWSRYQGIPKYDQALADHMQAVNHSSFLRFDFTSIGFEVFAPLAYFSESGVHSFQFPVIERCSRSDQIKEIAPQRFIDLVTAFSEKDQPGLDPTATKKRIENSIANLGHYLATFETNNRVANSPEMSFIEAEQSLILGHTVHPVPKSREGFTVDEMEKYSPETGGQFQLHYFLMHPSHVVEKSAEQQLITTQLKSEMLTYAATDTKELLNSYPEWKVVPVHPWEAFYLLNQPDVKEMQAKQILISLGTLGPLFTATSSVRTVYNADSEWMYKFSLHVKITNSFRVNYPHELNRGYHAAKLMKTDWGKDIAKDYPEIQLISDPAFITVVFQDRVIDGFSTSVRQNPFHGMDAKKNLGLVASLCQDGILGQPSRMLNVITEAAQRKGNDLAQTAVAWFKQYLNITIRPLVGIFNKYGFGTEFHQQNMLIELDEDLFPSKLYFRDNQGYAFRQGKSAELLSILPDFSKEPRSFLADERMVNFWSYYLVVNHLLGLINALGKTDLAEERTLIGLLYESLKAEEQNDSTGLVEHLLNSVNLKIKGNLLTSLHNMDEASAPSAHPAVYQNYPNPLNQYFFSEKLINPKGQKVVFSRYFEKENVYIALRPVDVDRDLEMLHEWFHREHALNIWQMNWPIRQLETFYRTMLSGGASHSYIGETNGDPNFNVEVYWASRDVVGEYYDVLPTDYGTHMFVASTDPKLKYVSPSTQSLVDFVFSEPKVGKIVGEGSVDSLASIMNKAHVGFKVQKVIKMPHKTANLNFCYREWYWEKFPAAQYFQNNLISESQV